MTESGGFGELRIGDTEREQAIRALGDHYSSGRIDLHEYEHRVAQVTSARTANDLRTLFRDLPAPHPMVISPASFPAPLAAPPVPGYPSGTSDKSKVAAGLLQILLPFGVGRFYTGHNGVAVGQLLLFLFGMLPCGIGSLAAVVWCLIDGIIILSSDSTDSRGLPLRS